MDDMGAFHHAHASSPVASGRIDQTGHQDTMGLQQVLFLSRIPDIEAIIGGESVSDLLDFPGRSDNPFPVEDSGYLRFTQRVPFYSQRPSDGTDAVDAPEPERPRLLAQDGQPPYGFADLPDEVDDGRGDGVSSSDHGQRPKIEFQCNVARSGQGQDHRGR